MLAMNSQLIARKKKKMNLLDARKCKNSHLKVENDSIFPVLTSIDADQVNVLITRKYVMVA